MKLILLKVKDIETGEIVHTVGPVAENRSDRVMIGMLTNMNRDKYCVIEEEVE